MKIAVVRLLIAGLSICVSGMLQAASTEELAQKYIKVFSGTSRQMQLDALNQLQWSGLPDPRVYDLVEQNLLEMYSSARSGDALDLASWYAKSLGTSGLEQYRVTLQGIIESDANKKVKKYALEGLDNLEKYAAWNPVLVSQENINPNKSHQVNVFANMLRSDDWNLRNIAAKRIFADHLHDTYLLDLLEEAIKVTYQGSYSDKTRIMAMAWMTRALASASLPKYQATLEEVVANAGTSKVRKYAKKYMKQYY